MVNEIYLLYAATDQNIAAAVREALEKVGFVVRDGRGASSESFRGSAREAVDASGALLVLWSEAMSDPDWVDADMKLIVAAWSRDRLLVARIDGAALPVGLRDQPCHELRSGQLDRDIGNLTLATLALDRAPEGESIEVRSKVRSWRAIPLPPSHTIIRDAILALSVVLVLALGGLAWFFFIEADNYLPSPSSKEHNLSHPSSEGYNLYQENALQAQRDLLAIDEALRQQEAEVNRLKEVRRKIEERLKASGEDRATADPPPVASPSTYSVISEPQKPWILWTGGAVIAITGIGAYYLVRVRRQRSAKPAPRPEKRGEPEAFIGIPSPLAAVGESFPTPQPPIFVSYSRKDEPVVQSIVQELRGSGYAVWIDLVSQQGVQRFAGSIVAAIRGCRIFALVGSRNAFASDHVIREVYVAGDFKKPFLVFEIDQVDFPDDILYFISGFPRVPMTDIATGKVQAAVSRLLAAA